MQEAHDRAAIKDGMRGLIVLSDLELGYVHRTVARFSPDVTQKQGYDEKTASESTL